MRGSNANALTPRCNQKHMLLRYRHFAVEVIDDVDDVDVDLRPDLDLT